MHYNSAFSKRSFIEAKEIIVLNEKYETSFRRPVQDGVSCSISRSGRMQKAQAGTTFPPTPNQDFIPCVGLNMFG
jgi:hypothetical protein